MGVQGIRGPKVFCDTCFTTITYQVFLLFIIYSQSWMDHPLKIKQSAMYLFIVYTVFRRVKMVILVDGVTLGWRDRRYVVNTIYMGCRILIPCSLNTNERKKRVVTLRGNIASNRVFLVNVLSGVLSNANFLLGRRGFDFKVNELSSTNAW